VSAGALSWCSTQLPAMSFRLAGPVLEVIPR
jgi:hypothetical protein